NPPDQHHGRGRHRTAGRDCSQDDLWRATLAYRGRIPARGNHHRVGRWPDRLRCWSRAGRPARPGRQDGEHGRLLDNRQACQDHARTVPGAGSRSRHDSIAASCQAGSGPGVAGAVEVRAKERQVAAVEVRDLIRKYRQGEDNMVRALDGVTLSIDTGEFVSLVGRSGSGKTTFLHCVGLLLRPTTGQVLIDGVDTTALTDGQRADFRGRRIGYVFRHQSLLPTLTALQNVMLPLRYGPIGTGGKKRARELLDLVGLGDLVNHRPGQLTVAESQRVAIARALIKAPALVVADEPTGEVDNETSDELLFLMQQLNRTSGVTFIIATHDIDVATCMDRVIRLSDGQVGADERLRVERGRRSSIR